MPIREKKSWRALDGDENSSIAPEVRIVSYVPRAARCVARAGTPDTRGLAARWEEAGGIFERPCECTPPPPYQANDAKQGGYLARMFEHRHQLRVRYAETDRMGYMYYGAYAALFEVARVEALRSLGISYRSVEEEGVMLPVRELNVRYHKPAFYDDQLTIITRIRTMPGVRIAFDYEVRNDAGALLTEASTTLVFIERANGRPCNIPAHMADLFKPYFG